MSPRLRATAGGLAALLLVHGAAAAAPKPVVLVPFGARGAACEAEATLAAELELAAGVELVRTAVDERETLEDARRRTDADVALAGERAGEGGPWILRAATPERPTAEAQGPALPALLRQLWPPTLPPLLRRAVPAAASPAALAAACAGDGAKAYALSRAAIGPALWSAIDPPSPPGRAEEPLGLEVARALAADRRGRAADALARAHRAAKRLGAGESWPLWQSAAGTGPAALSLAGGAALVLRGGTLECLDLATGQPRGRTVVGRIAAPLAALRGERALAAGPGALTAIDATTGAIVWSTELAAPWPEVVELDDRVIAAGTKEIVALSPASGEALWRLDAPVEPSAGPVRAGSLVVVPAETELLVIDPARGALVLRADVGDELSGPLAAAGSVLWFPIGADAVGRLDVASLSPARGARESTRLDRRAAGVRGASWPPALTSRGAVVAALDAKRAPVLARIEGAGDGPAEVLARGWIGPAVALGGERTLALEKRRDAVVALDGAGKVAWRVALGAPVVAVEVELTSAWIAAGSKVWTVDAASGRVDRVADVGEPLAALAVSADGAVAVGTSGAVWGLPGVEDPRVLPLLHRLRRAEARAALALNKAPEAAVALEAARALDPEDVEALVTLARLADRQTPAAAPRAWLRVLEAARPRDPAGTEARARLAATVGLVAVVPVGGAARAVIAARDRALVEVGPDIVAVDRAGAVLWRRPGRDLTLTNSVLTVDGTPIRASDGAPDPGATLTSTVIAPALSVSTTGGLVVTDTVKRLSTRPLEVGASGPAAATADRAWVARGSSILVLTLRPR